MSDHHLGEDLAAMAAEGAGLTPETLARHREHLAACASCQKALAEAQAVFRVLEALPAAEPSSGFDRALFARLDQEDALSGAIAPAAGFIPPRTGRDSSKSWLERLGERLFGPGRGSLGFALAGAGALGVVLLAGGLTLRSGNEPAPAEVAVAADLELAENLELYQNLDLLDDLDVADDLDLIEAMDEGAPG